MFLVLDFFVFGKEFIYLGGGVYLVNVCFCSFMTVFTIEKHGKMSEIKR
jgi:hypothetical protein